MRRGVPPVERFRAAAWAFFIYGLVDWSWAMRRGSLQIEGQTGAFWYGVGGLILVGVPWVLAGGTQGRGYLWISRIVPLFVVLRMIDLARAIVTQESEEIPVPIIGHLSTGLAAQILLGLAAIALFFIVRAAWFTNPEEY
ncbi:MAG: hypothetical protein O7H41_03495 [Planctomycetota bacterium]|nr:hypothetical protein [Planctomycetota bacterium]